MADAAGDAARESAGDAADDPAGDAGAGPRGATRAVEGHSDEAVDAGISPAAQTGTGRGRRHLLALTLGVAAAVVALDQVTKALAVAHLMDRPPIEVVGTLLRLTYAENTGAAFGLGTGFTWVFTAIAIVVAVVIVRTASRLGSIAWALALGGLLGGAVGNLIDRLVRPPGPGQGYVVDFIALPNFPVFNVADMSITFSAIGIVVLTLRGIDISGGRRA